MLTQVGPCRLIWDSGLACIAIASFCSSIGALCIKILDGRIPVFEIVVSLCDTWNCTAPSRTFSYSSCLSSLLQMVRSVISWAVTDALGRAQQIKPLYGNRKRYPILAVRGLMGAIAMSLYYEAFERLMLSEAVSTSPHTQLVLPCKILLKLNCSQFAVHFQRASYKSTVSETLVQG